MLVHFEVARYRTVLFAEQRRVIDRVAATGTGARSEPECRGRPLHTRCPPPASPFGHILFATSPAREWYGCTARIACARSAAGSVGREASACIPTGNCPGRTKAKLFQLVADQHARRHGGQRGGNDSRSKVAASTGTGSRSCLGEQRIVFTHARRRRRAWRRRGFNARSRRCRQVTPAPTIFEGSLIVWLDSGAARGDQFVVGHAAAEWSRPGLVPLPPLPLSAAAPGLAEPASSRR